MGGATMKRKCAFPLVVVLLCAATAASTAATPAQDRKLAETLVPLIWKCMTIPEEAKAAGATAVIQFELLNGYLVGDPEIIQQPATEEEQAMLRAATVRECNPYPPSISLFVRVRFDPNDIAE